MAKKTHPYPELEDILRELEIDVPVLNTKISGNKLILYLYGGRIVEYALPPQNGLELPANPEEDRIFDTIQSDPKPDVTAKANPSQSSGHGAKRKVYQANPSQSSGRGKLKRTNKS